MGWFCSKIENASKLCNFNGMLHFCYWHTFKCMSQVSCNQILNCIAARNKLTNSSIEESKCVKKHQSVSVFICSDTVDKTFKNNRTFYHSELSPNLIT